MKKIIPEEEIIKENPQNIRAYDGHLTENIVVIIDTEEDLH